MSKKEKFDIEGYAGWLGRLSYDFYQKWGLPKEVFLDELFKDKEKVELSIRRFKKLKEQGMEKTEF